MELVRGAKTVSALLFVLHSLHSGISGTTAEHGTSVHSGICFLSPNPEQINVARAGPARFPPLLPASCLLPNML
jgi:hypothetical protein